MSRNYKFNNHEAAYFVSFAVDYSDEKGLIDDIVVIRKL